MLRIKSIYLIHIILFILTVRQSVQAETSLTFPDTFHSNTEEDQTYYLTESEQIQQKLTKCFNRMKYLTWTHNDIQKNIQFLVRYTCIIAKISMLKLESHCYTYEENLFLDEIDDIYYRLKTASKNLKNLIKEHGTHVYDNEYKIKIQHVLSIVSESDILLRTITPK